MRSQIHMNCGRQCIKSKKKEEESLDEYIQRKHEFKIQQNFISEKFIEIQ